MTRYWELDKYAKTPRPYWSNDRQWLFGTRHARENQPSHFMPLPPPPSGAAPVEGDGRG